VGFDEESTRFEAYSAWPDPPCDLPANRRQRDLAYAGQVIRVQDGSPVAGGQAQPLPAAGGAVWRRASICRR
jgi:hypothetical protein